MGRKSLLNRHGGCNINTHLPTSQHARSCVDISCQCVRNDEDSVETSYSSAQNLALHSLLPELRDLNQRNSGRGMVYLISSDLLHIPVKIDGAEMNALVDSGASVSIINRKQLDINHLHAGKVIRVQGYDGLVSSHNKWASVVTEFQGHSVTSTVLPMPNVAYNFLLSHPDMKNLKINLYWDDKVLIEDESPRTTKDPTTHPLRIVHCEQDIKDMYPELVYIGSYPHSRK